MDAFYYPDGSMVLELGTQACKKTVWGSVPPSA